MYKTIITLLWLSITVTNCVYAQRTGREKPRPTRFAEYKMTTTNDTTYFYIYNPATELFWPYNGYDNRNTILAGAPVNTYKVAFAKHEPEPGTRWDGAVRITYYDKWQNKFTELMLDGGDYYMPESEGSATSLILKHNADGSFKITASQRNMSSWITRKMNVYWCVDKVKDGSIRGPFWYDTTLWTDDNHYYTDWLLVSPDDFEAMKHDLESYYGAEALQALIDKTTAEHPRINLSRPQAVCADMGASIEQMNEMKSLIDSAVALSKFIDTTEQKHPMCDTLTAINLLSTDTYTTADIERVTHDMQVEQRRYDVAKVLEGATSRYPHDVAPLWPARVVSGDDRSWTSSLPNVVWMRIQNAGYSYNPTEVYSKTYLQLYIAPNILNQPSESYPNEQRLIPDCSVYRYIDYLPRGHYRFTATVDVGCKSPGGTSGVYMMARCSEYEQIARATADVAEATFNFDFYSPGADTIAIGFKFDKSHASYFRTTNIQLWYYGDVEGNPAELEQQHIIGSYESLFPHRSQIEADADCIEAYYDALDALRTADDFAACYARMVEAASQLSYSVCKRNILRDLAKQCEQNRIAYADSNTALSEKMGDLTMILDGICADASDLEASLHEELGIGLWDVSAYIDQIIADATDIHSISKPSTAIRSIYNIMGTARLAPQRGINIVDGKKVLVK